MPVPKTGRKLWCSGGRRSSGGLGQDAASSSFSLPCSILELSGQIILLRCKRGEWGVLLRGVRWEVCVKLGERLNLPLAREPQYPISLGEAEEKQSGCLILLKRQVVCLAKQEKQPDMGVRFVGE